MKRELSSPVLRLGPALLFALIAAACGKKGPPLPPLVRLPVAPADFSAALRGTRVDLQFTVPSVNTDNSRPANIARVDVYAVTSNGLLTENQMVKLGTRVASVPVKAPRDPDSAVEEDDPDTEVEPPEGKGLDQGAVARVSETLASTALAPVSVPVTSKDRSARSSTPHVIGPLLPPQPMPVTRTYVATGVSTRDKRGPFSRRIAVPLIPPPPAPARARVTYDEQAITVTWDPINDGPRVQPAPEGGALPSTPIGAPSIATRYNLYDATNRAAPIRLTQPPLSELTFADTRIAWGEERCYAARAVRTVGDLTIESDPSPVVCTTLKDTFPPSPPANLQSSPLEGAITLIWDANTEKDLDGYIVLRGASTAALQPITEMIHVTTFRDDHLTPGVRFTYAIEAVDKAGNISKPSNTAEEAAR